MRALRPHEYFWVVPIRRVFPWWYFLGLVVSIAVPVAVTPDSSTTPAALWGPVIGLTLQERWRSAAVRKEKGLGTNRRDLVGPPWVEPLFAALWTVWAVGLAWTLGFVFGRVPVGLRWTGTGLMISAALVSGMILLVRTRRDLAGSWGHEGAIVTIGLRRLRRRWGSRAKPEREAATRAE